MSAYKWTPKRLRTWKRTLELYKITPRQLNEIRKALIIAQGYRCGCCNRSLARRICFLDHDHHSGALRGILCFGCNRFRVAKNSKETAEYIVRYLNNPPAHAFMERYL